LQTLKHGLLLSFLDWNRANGRELRDLRRIGKDNYARYKKLTEAYARDTGVEFDSSECAGIRSNRSFLALCTDQSDGRQSFDDFDIVSSRTNLGMAPRDVAERYAEVPNRAYLFMTGMDVTLGSIIRGYVSEIGQLSADYFDIAVPFPMDSRVSPYDYFQSMYWFSKSRARRQDIPFFLLYSSMGHVVIHNQNGNFDRYYLRQIFRALADEFADIKGPATQKQLNGIAKTLRELSARPTDGKSTSNKKRFPWGALVASVTVIAGVFTILASYEPARQTVCDLVEATNLSICTSAE
jgi:hypothetical protein